MSPRVFTLSIKNPSRATTKDEWKRVSRYLRITDGLIKERLGEIQPEIDRAFVQLVVYGKSLIGIPGHLTGAPVIGHFMGVDIVGEFADLEERYKKVEI